MFKRIDHFELVPSDIEKTLAFYQDVLGFTLKVKIPVGVPPMKEVFFLTLGDTMIEIILAENPVAGLGDAWHVGFRGMALEVESMDRAVAWLKEKGVPVVKGPVDLGSSLRAEIRDPDGLMIELREWK